MADDKTAIDQLKNHIINFIVININAVIEEMIVANLINDII